MKLKTMLIQSILLQIIEPATNAHQHLIIGMIATTTIFYVVSIIVAMRALRKKTAEIKLLQQQYVSRIDLIRKDHGDTLEKIRVEMLKHEEERTRQWMESERETLHVLNGVSMLLDLNDKIEKNESEKILKTLEEIREKVEKITPKD
jgi:hypothetical protein